MRIGIKNRIKNLFRRETLYVGELCKWRDIAVGEVFAESGCWSVLCKISPKKALVLARDYTREFCSGVEITFWVYENVYKLPLATQKLWRGR